MSNDPNNSDPHDELPSLSIAAARNLVHENILRPQMVGATPRWFLHMLPWVDLEAGIYRVNRRKLVTESDEKIEISEDDELQARHLQSISFFKMADQEQLDTLIDHFKRELFKTGDVIIKEGETSDRLFIVLNGKAEAFTTGHHGQKVRINIIGEGVYFGEISLIREIPHTASVSAITPMVVLSVSRDKFVKWLDTVPGLRERIENIIDERIEIGQSLVNEFGERKIDMVSGHSGAPEVPDTFVDYELNPREYELSVIQSTLRMHTRVAEIYNHPHDQLREQFRLTIEAMKERQEWEIINNREFGLLHEAPSTMRLQSRKGPPTPDDMDELLSKVWKKPAFFLAHPKAIAAFGRECTRRGVPPPTTNLYGSPFLTWRGVPIIPTDKLMINQKGRRLGTTNILLMRVGEDEQGVVGLHQSNVSGEGVPSLSVRFMGVDNRSLASYMLSLYFSAAVLVDDALGVLENVEVTNYYDYA